MDVPGVPYLPVFLADLHAAHGRHTAVPPGQEELFDLERARALAPTLGAPAPPWTKAYQSHVEPARIELCGIVCGSDTCFDPPI